MFKRTNKAWKALALVLALCMLSTIVYAEDPSTASVSITTTAANAYNETEMTATIAGAITPGKDVTIIALRDANTVTKADFQNSEVWTTTKLQDQVVYIDQVETDETTGAYEFKFIPRTGVAGGKITVFVGGEDVTEIQTLSFDAKVTAPALVPQAWYEGEDTLQIKLVKQNDANTLYGDGAAAWAAKINAVTVDGADKKAATSYDAETGMLEISGFALEEASVSSITITTTANEYTDATWTGTAAQAKKAAGTLSVDDTEYVAGEEITFTASDVEGWAALSNVYAKASESTLEADAIDTSLALTEGKAVAALTDATNNLEETYYAAAKVQYFENSNVVSYKVVAPTKAAADDATATLAYDATIDADPTTATAEAADTDTTDGTDEWKSMYGAAVVTLATPADGSGLTYAWTVSSTDGGADATIDNNDTSVTLDRPNYVAPADVTDATPKAYTYTLTLTVTKDGYKEATNTFTVSASRVGMKGATVTITPNFTNENIAKSATYTLTPESGQPIAISYVEGVGFKADGVALGEYTMTIARAGYVTQTVTVTVNSDGIDAEMPAMIAGDVAGDGIIDGSDVSALGTSWGARTGDASYQERADLNADGVVDGSDVSLLGTNWGYRRAN